MATKHKIIFGDSRFMNSIEDESVQLIVTSPPYWQLKDYDHESQIGFNQSYPEYIKSLNEVWTECHRVLEPGCRMCINIGDQFTRADLYGRYKIIPIREEIIRFSESIGFDYMGAIIWQKVTTCNTSGGASIMGSFPYPRNGIMKLDYEFILIFKKLGDSKRKISPQVKEKSKIIREEWKEWFNGHWYFPGEKQNEHIAMFPIELPNRLIRMFTFHGETVLDPFSGSGSTSAAAILSGRNSIGYEINPDLKDVISKKLNGCINLTNIDDISIDYIYEKAPSEEELYGNFCRKISKLINNAEIINDLASDNMNFDCNKMSSLKQHILNLSDNNMKNIISEKYIDYIIDRLKEVVEELGKFLDKKKLKVLAASSDEMIKILNSLKSQFFHTIKNIERLNTNYEDYKSKIRKSDDENIHSSMVKVVEILDVDSLRIENGQTVKLCGIKAFDDYRNEALKYLKTIVLNHKVELEFEKTISNQKSAYVKLKDKTHINAKLIKEGLADFDGMLLCKFSKRFSKYLDEAKSDKKGYWKDK